VFGCSELRNRKTATQQGENNRDKENEYANIVAHWNLMSRHYDQEGGGNMPDSSLYEDTSKLIFAAIRCVLQFAIGE
jgi:hypothetical protein